MSLRSYPDQIEQNISHKGTKTQRIYATFLDSLFQGNNAIGQTSAIPVQEAESKCYILVKVKAGGNFNRRRHEVSALGVNTLSILTIRI